MASNNQNTPDDKAESIPQETAQAPVQLPTQTPAKKAKPVEKGGFCVYLGPSIQGVIVSGTVFSNDKKATLKELQSVIEKYPLVADLIVLGKNLPECRIKVKTSGNFLYVNYNKLAGQLKSK